MPHKASSPNPFKDMYNNGLGREADTMAAAFLVSNDWDQLFACLRFDADRARVREPRVLSFLDGCYFSNYQELLRLSDGTTARGSLEDSPNNFELLKGHAYKYTGR